MYPVSIKRFFFVFFLSLFISKINTDLTCSFSRPWLEKKKREEKKKKTFLDQQTANLWKMQPAKLTLREFLGLLTEASAFFVLIFF